MMEQSQVKHMLLFCARIQNKFALLVDLSNNTRKIQSNLVLCLNLRYDNLIKNSQAVKKGAAPKKAMMKKDVKSKVAAKKWL